VQPIVVGRVYQFISILFALGGWSLIFQLDANAIMSCTMFWEKPER